MQAGVTDCGRSCNWSYNGWPRLGFKQKGRLPGVTGTMRDPVGPYGSIVGERTLTGLLWGGATWFWFKNWRSQQHSWQCWELQEACPAEHRLLGGTGRSELMTSVFFFWKAVLLTGMLWDWPDWAKAVGREGVQQDCVFVGASLSLKEVRFNGRILPLF